MVSTSPADKWGVRGGGEGGGGGGRGKVVLVEMVVKEVVVVRMVLGCMKNMRHVASFKNDIGS
jgi:hypothetical protein